MHGVERPVERLIADCLAAGGEMGGRMRAHDWSASPLGPPDDWPVSLRTLVSLMLNAQQAMFIAWGPQLAFLYNDAYAPIFGERHPDALGRPFAEVWSDIWPQIEPLVSSTVAGDASWHEDLLIPMTRRGSLEEAYFSFSYTPVQDESGKIAGMFCAATETTAKVKAEKHLASESERLRELFKQAPGFVAVLRGPDHVFEMVNDAYLQLVGHRSILGKPLADALPEVAQQGFDKLLDHVYETGRHFVGSAMPASLQRQPDLPLEERLVDFVYEPVRGADGAVNGIFVQGVDVTESKRASDALRVSESRASSLLEGMAEGFLLIGPDFRILQINAEGLRIDGRSPEKIIGRSHWDVWPASVGTAVEDAYRRAMRERISVTIEHRYVFDDRHDVWLELRIFPLADGGLAAFFRDVTDRRHAAEALRNSEARLKAVLDSVPIGIVIADAQTGQILAGNPQTETIFRHPIYPTSGLEEYAKWRVRHSDGSMLAPEDYPISRAMRTGEPTGSEEYLYERGDGSLAWMRFAAAPIRNGSGDVVGGVVAIVDVDEEKKAEQALRRSEERLQLALEASTIIGTWDWDVRANLVYADGRFATLFGIDHQRAAAGVSIREIVDGVHPDDRVETQRILEEALAGGESYSTEFRTVDSVGTVHWVTARGRCYYQDGKPVRFPGVAVEITERKRWEEQQRLLVNELNHRVKNTLAMVQSIAAQTLRNAATTKEARATFEGRLIALAKAHDVLTRENWEGADLMDIVREATAPYTIAQSDRFRISGPAVRLPPRMALATAMVVQELVTNAIKYGALSIDGGTVDIHWELSDARTEGEVPRMHLRWQERDGPPVNAPSRRGFGSRLIEHGLAQDLGAEATLAFATGGLVCTIDVPVSSLSNGQIGAA
jgi:PAS domain S-box-containing protein